jgi:hypothetical protein
MADNQDDTFEPQVEGEAETKENKILMKLTKELNNPAMDTYNPSMKGERQSVLGKKGLGGGEASTLRKMCQDPARLEEFRQLAESAMRKQSNSFPIVPTMFFEMRKNEIEFVRSCLETGVSVDVKSSDTGRTMLHEASSFGYKDMCKMLVTEFGAKVSPHTLLGSTTPLHLAAAAGQRNLCFMLLSWGAKVNAKDSIGRIPLHYAATKNTARMLCENKSDVVHEDVNGETPIEAAQQRGDSEVMDRISVYIMEREQKAIQKLHDDQEERAAVRAAKNKTREDASKTAKFAKFREAQMKEYESWKHTTNREKQEKTKQLQRPTNYSIFKKDKEDLTDFLS